MTAPTKDLTDAVGVYEGKPCKNHPADVQLVKRLLDVHAKQIGLASPLDVTNPYCGEKTVKAIENFQRTVMRKGPPYGRVLPMSRGGTTFKALLNTATGSPAGATLGSSAREAMGYFIKKGWTPAQAAGIVANLETESQLNPRAVGDGGTAYGIAQWHPDRQHEFQRVSGHSIRTSNLAQQLAFVHYELTRGIEMPAGNLLRASTHAYQAGSIISKNYERPAKRAREAASRGKLAEQLLAAY